MADPFTNQDAASPEMIEIIVAGLETRAADPSMPPVIAACFDALNPPDSGLIVDAGADAGGVTRRIADRFPRAQAPGVEPSVALTDRAKALAGARADLDFRTGDGAERHGSGRGAVIGAGFSRPSPKERNASCNG